MALWPLFSTIGNQFFFGLVLLLTTTLLVRLDRLPRLSFVTEQFLRPNPLSWNRLTRFTRTGLRSLLYAVFLTLLSFHLAYGNEQERQFDDTEEIADQYLRILRLEHRLRSPASAPADTRKFSSLVDAYVGIATNHPRSEYASRALWQAAGISVLLYDIQPNEDYRKQSVKLLSQLQRGYPDSPLTQQISTRLDQVTEAKRINETATLVNITHQNIGTTTRVIIELDSERTVTTRQHQQDPLFTLDFTGVSLEGPVGSNLTFSNEASVLNVSPSEHETFTRVSLQLKERVNCHTFEFYDPFRVLVDCREIEYIDTHALDTGHVEPDDTETVSLATISAPTSPSVPSQAYTNTDSVIPLVRQLGLGVSRVVIDPGHGGCDPGASANGVFESQLTLDVAKRLAEHLSNYNIETVLTRKADEYVSLEARTAIANQADADLFLSLHFNASGKPNTTGIETYILDFATTEAAEEAARRENRLSTKTFTDLNSLVTAISQTTKRAESSMLANAIQEQLVETLRTENPTLPSLGVKSAPFLVLLGAKSPSVLAELSFVSNPKEASLLKTDTYRELIAQGLLEGVLRYSKDLKVEHQIGRPAEPAEVN